MEEDINTNTQLRKDLCQQAFDLMDNYPELPLMVGIGLLDNLERVIKVIVFEIENRKK